MTQRIVGINFDHFHMGDLLRMAHEHPGAEIVGIADETPARMVEAQKNFGLSDKAVFADYRECLERAQPDLVILCPSAARHADWVERVAPYEVAILVEKPFASNLVEADRMLAAMAATGRMLAINWPLAWMRSHRRCHELIREGLIGEVLEVHYHDGNRGPLRHGADKREREPSVADKAASWFYRADEGGGSLQDYLGYGTTLATWFNGGQVPIEVMAMWDCPQNGLEVDEHSITLVRYATGLSKFETRWGALSDPWTRQTEPRCGYVVRGSEGTIASWDYADHVVVQTRRDPHGKKIEAPVSDSPNRNPVECVLHCLSEGLPLDGPLSPAMSRIGQRIVDTAMESVRQGRVVSLLP